MTDDPVHFEARTETGRGRGLSRRTALRGAAALLPVAVGLRTVAAQETPTPDPATEAPPADTAAGDITALNGLLVVENLLAALYKEALLAYNDEAFTTAGLPPALRRDLEQARDAEASHVTALVDIVTRLGGTPPAATNYAWGYTDIPGFLKTATTLENAATAAYAGAAPLVRDAQAVQLLLGIHSVEARHAAYIADQIGETAFPATIDQPMTADEVGAVLAPFLVGGAPTPSPAPAEGEATEAPAAEAAPTATPEPQIEVEPPPAEQPTVEAPAPVEPTPEPAAQGDAGAAADSGGGGSKKNRKNRKDNAGADTGGSADTGTQPTGGGQGGGPGDVAQGDAVATAPVAGTGGLDAVVADAAAQFGISAQDVRVVTNEPRDWPDSSLGCPQPGEVYAQVITPGSVVLVEAPDGNRIEYHLDGAGNFIRCHRT